MEIIVRSGNRHAKDVRGERVDFKEPYFDQGLRRAFRSAEEKSAHMIKLGICQNGDSDHKAKKERKQAYEQDMDTKRRK